jgi:hypothetical protein
MDDPLGFLRTADDGSLLLITTAAALTWTRLFPQLNTKQAPCGIVSLQLAFTPSKAAAVIDSWRQHHLDGPAKRSLFTDLGFIVCYAWTLGLLASIAGRAAHASGLLNAQDAHTAAAALAISGWTAAFLDIAENGGLWLQLAGHLKPPLTAASSTVSASKWFLAFGSVLASIDLLIGSVI